MLIELFDKLMDRIIQLVKQKQEQNVTLYRDQVEPLQKAFEQLHDDYISAFREYKNSLDGTRESLVTLVTQVKDDRLFSEHNRQRVLALGEANIPEELEEYLGLLQLYLMNPFRVDTSGQRWRGTLADELNQCLHDDDPMRVRSPKLVNTEAQNVITNLVEKMQDLHGRITTSHHNLRRKLLRPI